MAATAKAKKAPVAEPQDTTTTVAAKPSPATGPRVNYSPDADTGVLNVLYDGTKMPLEAGKELFGDEKLRDHLALMGLIHYLQRETMRRTDGEKMDIIEASYDKLVAQKMEVFTHRGRPRGPKKADKIAALAAMKGVTPDAVREAISKMPMEKQDALLNKPEVLAKVEEMKEQQLDLDL